MEPILSEWSLRIASAAAPDEVDLAPFITKAFVAGGAQRRQLFRRDSANTPGGFGVECLTAMLPYILNGLATAGQMLSTVLTLDHVGKFLTAIKDLLDIREKVGRDEKVSNLPDDPYSTLKKIIAVLGKELQSAQVPEEQRDLITFRVLKAMLEEPSGAAAFCSTLQENGHE